MDEVLELGPTVDQVEQEAEEVAMWNPRHAIEGWLSGHAANGDEHLAAVMARALELQDEWQLVRYSNSQRQGGGR